MRQTRKNKLAIIRRIYSSVGNRFELNPTLQTCVDALGEAMEASRCFIHLKDTDGLYPVTHEFVAPGVTPLGPGNAVLVPGVYLAHQLAETVWAEKVIEDSRFGQALDRHVLSELQVRSCFATPILLKGSELGLIGIHHCKQTHRWTQDEIDLVETVAAQLAVLIQSCCILKEQEKLANSLATMNQDLSTLYVELAAKDEQIDRFMHLISHDLRAPVVAIEGLVDLLKQMFMDEPPESKPRRYLDLIGKSTTQITGLTAALVDYARLGQSTLHLEQVDTYELVREIWQRCTLGVDNIDLEIFGTLPVVRADRARLTQVFQNILENAVKYRRLEGRAIIDVTCQELADLWQFAINDNGIGFCPSEAERLFDIFTRLKQVRSKPGCGIGLASVLEIARLHGGKAWATGRPEKGSTFYFTLSKRIPERRAIPGH